MDAQAAYVHARTQLVRLRLVALVQRARNLAQAQDVHDDTGDVIGAFDPLLAGVREKREALGFYQFLEKSRLDDVIAQLQLLKNRGLAVTGYV